MNVSLDTLLTAQMVDALNVLVWQNTTDGQKGVNHPKSVAKILMGVEDEHENESYTSGEEFLAARQRIIEEIEEIENGNRIS